MKKVILIHPPTRYLLIPKWTIPLTLLYLRSYLISKGYEVSILDLADAGEDYLSKIPLDADAYGVTLYTPQEQLAKDISFYLKEKTKAVVVAGGHHVTFLDVPFMKESRFDAVVRGEGEIPFEKILEGKEFKDVLSVTYRNGNDIVRNEMRPFVENIDIYPFPRLDGVNVKEYPGTYIQKPHSDYRVAAILSRGCVGKCAFCSSVNFWKRKLRFHSFEWIKSNIEYLADYGVRDLEILDDNFIIHKNFTELCLLFKEHKMQYSCMGISRHMSPEKSKLLKDTGCSYIALGIESGSDRLLNAVDKSSRIQDHVKAIKILKENGLVVKGLFMVGLPGTTQEDIDLTVKFIKENPLDVYGLTTFVPFPGTPIRENSKEFGYEIDETIPFSDYLMMSKTMDTKMVVKNSDVVKRHRDQVLDVMGEKCTLFNSIKKGMEYQNKKRNA
ncbi:MAG: B12-binding domain-containing radical SAM protein [Candidatus Omnitrophica bacterium]|nr:B12-binding domain-containing radical SAM protein [Candidatus Omnitrophota bacterium]